jgi:hypothetical protein
VDLRAALVSKSSGFTKLLLGGFNLAGTYTYETGEQDTIRSGNDANLNGDNAGDRAIFNPSGTEGVGSRSDSVVPRDRRCTCVDTEPSLVSRKQSECSLHSNW